MTILSNNNTKSSKKFKSETANSAISLPPNSTNNSNNNNNNNNIIVDNASSSSITSTSTAINNGQEKLVDEDEERNSLNSTVNSSMDDDSILLNSSSQSVVIKQHDENSRCAVSLNSSKHSNSPTNKSDYILLINRINNSNSKQLINNNNNNSNTNNRQRTKLTKRKADNIYNKKRLSNSQVVVANTSSSSKMTSMASVSSSKSENNENTQLLNENENDKACSSSKTGIQLVNSSSNEWNDANKLDESGDLNNNSEDEYEQPAFNMRTHLNNKKLNNKMIGIGNIITNNNNCSNELLVNVTNIEELERKFYQMLKEKKGYIIKPMKEDGACLFRAVADQIYGDEEMHSTIRTHCMDYILKNADYFKQYMTEDVERYVSRKRHDRCYGNHIEIIAITEIYNRPIEVYEYSLEPKNIFQSVFQTDNEPIRLSYHGRNHYNSVVDPNKATIGVGLGLPQFLPGLADKNLIDEALKKSEELQIEQAMLDDKLKATDWEATNEELMEMVARESYLQWVKDNEKRNFKTSNPSYDDYLDNLMNHNAPCSSWDSLRNDFGSSHCGNTKSNNTASSNNNNNNSSDKNKKLFDDWSNYETVVDDEEEDDILAKVLQDSQQEYLENLKSNRSQKKD